MSTISKRFNAFSSIGLVALLGALVLIPCTPVLAETTSDVSSTSPNPSLAIVAASTFGPTRFVALQSAWEFDTGFASGEKIAAPWKQDEDWILRALADGMVISTKPIGHGITNPFKAEIEFEDRRIHAVWKPLQKTDFAHYESYQAEVAAYRLSQFLGLDMVPPTVKRKIGRRFGSLQFWVDDYTMLTDVLPDRPYDFFRSDQVQLMRFFDQLIDNPDRNAGNYLVNSQWQIVLIDHSRAMDYNNTGPRRDEKKPARFQTPVVERLALLNLESLNQLLGDLLPKQDLRGLNLSAKRLLRFANEQIEIHGSSVLFDEPKLLYGDYQRLTQTLEDSSH